jgi:hypothetical protein
MDVESRIRELKAELEYLEAQRGANPTDDMGLEPLPPPPGAGQWPPAASAAPLDKTLPYRNPATNPMSPSAPYMQNMPYKKPARKLDRPNPYIKKL